MPGCCAAVQCDLRVVLVAAEKRLAGLRLHQLDLRPHRDALPGPVLHATARFSAAQAGRPVGKVFQKAVALKLQTHDFAALPVDPAQLKYALDGMDTTRRFAILHPGPSGLPVKIFVSSTLVL
jgi:hypothetical protein